MKSKKINFEQINAIALASFESLLRQWLPDGKKSGAEYASVNPTRNDGHAGSFSINIHKGVWSDFASGDSGSDPISLYAYLFHNNDQGAAAKELGELLGVDNKAPAPKAEKPKKPKSEWVAILPPVDVPEPNKAHLVRGVPESMWCYRNFDGQAIGYMYRFKTSDGGKEVLPLTWCRNSLTGAEEWRWMGFKEPRYLYGLDRLADKPNATVLITEGEKCADAAHEQLPELACLTWPGGSKAVSKIDWKPLAGRKVVIWPDCDAQMDKSGVLLEESQQPGVMAAAKIADILLALGCRVWMMAIPKPGERVSGWDIADIIESGLKEAPLAEYIRAKSRLLAVAGFGDEDLPGPDNKFNLSEDWKAGLIEKPRGGLEDCRENVYLILLRHPLWQGVIGWNDFTRRIEKIKPTPFGSSAGEWKTSDDYETGLWLAQQCGLLLKSEGTIIAGVAMCADKNKFHPPRDWIEALPVWDKTPRLEYFISDSTGCEHNRYSQLVGKYFMIGMVARIFKPGCPMQYMPILEGLQGIGKSSLWRAIGGEWFQDTPLKLGDKDAYMQLNGTLVYEIAEMDSFNKAESTLVKGFITQENDRFREPYGRRPVDNPRQCVFVGTTNHGEYLKDTTGNRRFWPIKAINIDLEQLKANREQLFAEAFFRFKAGERWHPDRKEEREHFVPEQDARRIVDPWLYPLQDYLEDVENRLRVDFTTTDLLLGALKVELNKIDGNRGMATRVGNLMAELGWERKRRTTGRREWAYVRPDNKVIGV
ncbi:MAG: VapE domain-containing protein [Methylobacter sp.]